MSRTPDRPAARWGFARVAGASMTPTLRSGDVLLVRYRPRRISSGQVVVARFVDGTVAVKRVASVQASASVAESSYWLLSDNPAEGVDSRHRGALGHADLIAVVACRVWPPRRGGGLTMGLFRSV